MPRSDFDVHSQTLCSSKISLISGISSLTAQFTALTFIPEDERDRLSNLASHFRNEARLSLLASANAKNPDMVTFHAGVAEDAIRNCNLLEGLLIRDGVNNAYLWKIDDGILCMIPREF